MNLLELVESCERGMQADLQNQDIGFLIEHLKKFQSLLALQGKMEAEAHSSLNKAKKAIIETYMASDKELKAHEFKMWSEGEMEAQVSMQLRTDRVIKSMDRYCENLRTLISAEKELAKI